MKLKKLPVCLPITDTIETTFMNDLNQLRLKVHPPISVSSLKCNTSTW